MYKSVVFGDFFFSPSINVIVEALYDTSMGQQILILNLLNVHNTGLENWLNT